MKKCIAAANVLLGIGAAPCIAQAQSYTVSLGNMMVFSGVSKGLFSNDSDYATVVAVGSDGKQQAITGGPVELGSNDHHNWQMETDPVTVPANAASKLRIKYAVTNAGHTDNDQNKVKDALNDALLNAGTRWTRRPSGQDRWPHHQSNTQQGNKTGCSEL